MDEKEQSIQVECNHCHNLVEVSGVVLFEAHKHLLQELKKGVEGLRNDNPLEWYNDQSYHAALDSVLTLIEKLGEK